MRMNCRSRPIASSTRRLVSSPSQVFTVSLIRLAIGAPHDDDGGSDRGAVWIVSLEDS